MAQFSSAAEFYQSVEFFDRDDRARAALPMLLDKEIKGFGFALACDFLKELGYVNFAKPDVHLRDIFIGLKLCPANADDYEIFKAVVRVAKNAQVTPYNVDKLFWLIGSGDFYDDEQIGEKGKIGSHKAKFIAYAQAKLGQ
jgi:thermostable 8-oxoguanine DNA glycosylase